MTFLVQSNAAISGVTNIARDVLNAAWMDGFRTGILSALAAATVIVLFAVFSRKGG